MKFAYDDLVILSQKYNMLLQKNNLDILCYVSGETMFMKEAILGETSKANVLYQYLQGDSFILDIVKTAKNLKKISPMT